MTTRTERDRQKAQQERHQMILAQMLKDDDNKYCVDCDAKGPRWASWNLGVFLCIRCAGIHRNLGVHISKVKSVNLDTWTQEQVSMMQEVGNSRARAAYEANIPDGFRRPQSDSGLEAFIRAKYEHKKYLAREWVPPKPSIPKYDDDANVVRVPSKNRDPVFEEMPKNEKKKAETNPVSRPAVQKTAVAKAEPEPLGRTAVNPTPAAQPQTPKQSIDNLLSLDDPVIPAASANDDPFGEFIGNTGSAAPTNSTNHNISSNTENLQNGSENLFGGMSDLNGLVVNGAESCGSAAETADGKKSKESILALFGNMPQQQQHMYGFPGGMYKQQGMSNMYGGAHMQNGGMMMMHNNLMPGYSQMQMGGGMGMMGGGQMGMPQVSMGGGMMGGGVPASSSMGGFMGGGGGQMGGQMYSAAPTMNTAAYNAQYQQAQHQMAAMNLGGPIGGGYGRMGTVRAGGGSMSSGMGGGWGAMASGNTMSTNLWQ